jgi:AraC-like DNA-binding protein
MTRHSEKAAQFLADENQADWRNQTLLPISEISYKTGFNNPAYFTNCFKKVHKVSPSEYLQNISTSPNN